MEVHHHSHTSRKKWSHYFWEFLMLFLAVFCGFLAENQREHYIEHQRERQFIKSLVLDVNVDIVKLEELISSRIQRLEKLDSILYLLNSDSADRCTNRIYFLAVQIPRITTYQFTPSDGTILQLKNSGALRLIRSRVVRDSIIKYDAAVRSLLRLDQQEQDVINIQRETAPQIFNGIDLGRFSDSNNLPFNPGYSPALVAGYKDHLNVFNYRITSSRNVNKGYSREARKLQKQAINLLQTLKDEYRLK
jgi:hypothetical protein